MASGFTLAGFTLQPFAQRKMELNNHCSPQTCSMFGAKND
jgi:hypothetical protein